MKDTRNISIFSGISEYETVDINIKQRDTNILRQTVSSYRGINTEVIDDKYMPMGQISPSKRLTRNTRMRLNHI